MGNLLCMGVFLRFLCYPTPIMGEVANNGLSARVHCHMLNGDFLLSLALIAIQGFHEDGITCVPRTFANSS